MTGKFVTLEGIEGAGKSTISKRIVDHLSLRGIEFTASREPGGTAFAEKLRGLLLDPDNTGMDSITELLLMFAARADHLNRLIRPALETGRWVLLDRFTDATYAYQGGGRQVSRDLIAALETLVQGELRPDLTVLLDLPAAQGLQRSSTPAGTDRFENERLEFFERVRVAYLEQARREPERVRVIDATQPLERVSEEVVQCLETLM